LPGGLRFKRSDFGKLESKNGWNSTRKFLALENHSLDVPFWQDLVTGIEKLIVNKGFIKIPDKPGLGVTLNDEEVKRHSKPGTGYFEPTPMWNEAQSWDDALFS
jgi:hypothetical protein